MTVYVHDIDADGCIFNKDYRALRNARLKHEHERLRRSNLKLVEHLNSCKKELTDRDTMKLMVFSNRQSYKIDTINMRNNDTDSIYAAITRLSTSENIPLDMALLADFYENLEPGTSFERAYNKYCDKRSSDVHANWLFDEHKISIIYAQAHYLANQHPDEDIVITLYDDRDDILDEINTFYTRHPYLLPNTVQIQSCHYDGNAVKLPQQVIRGNGNVDKHYQKSIQTLKQYSPTGKHIDFSKNVDVNRFIADICQHNEWEYETVEPLGFFARRWALWQTRSIPDKCLDVLTLLVFAGSVTILSLQFGGIALLADALFKFSLYITGLVSTLNLLVMSKAACFARYPAPEVTSINKLSINENTNDQKLVQHSPSIDEPLQHESNDVVIFGGPAYQQRENAGETNVPPATNTQAAAHPHPVQ